MTKWQLPPKGGNMEAANGIYFQNMTRKEVRERLKTNDVLLLPVGSTENHGDSAPYGEDTFLDTRLCEQVQKQLDVLWLSRFGMVPIHASFGNAWNCNDS